MNKYNEILQFLQSLSDEQMNSLLKDKQTTLQTNNIQEEEEINIESLLKELCVNPCILGFNYLKDAIEMCLKDQNMLCGVTKVLYPTIAEKYKTTTHRVERAIRHAIETSWGKIDGETYHQVFYNELDKLTNSRYIAYVCSYIKNIKEANDKQLQKSYK